MAILIQSLGYPVLSIGNPIHMAILIQSLGNPILSIGNPILHTVRQYMPTCLHTKGLGNELEGSSYVAHSLQSFSIPRNAVVPISQCLNDRWKRQDHMPSAAHPSCTQTCKGSTVIVPLSSWVHKLAHKLARVPLSSWEHKLATNSQGCHCHRATVIVGTTVFV